MTRPFSSAVRARHVVAMGFIGVATLAPLSSAATEPVVALSEAGVSQGAGIPWEKGFKNAMKKARSLGRPVMVDFWAEWCHWCHELDATTYRDPGVVASAREFVPVKVDTEGSLEEKQLSAEYGVDILPTIAFLSPRGHVILFRDKFESPATFATTLAAAREAAGEVMGWEDALSRRADDPSTLAQLGAHLFGQRRFEESRQLLERAAKLDADRPVDERKRTRIVLGRLLARAGRNGEAEKQLKAAIALQPAATSEDADALLALEELAKP